MRRQEDPAPVERRFKHPIGVPVHAVLWREWDPISVGNVGDWPDDEYDAYVWPVIGKVMSGASEEEVADYLDWASNENMGCPLPRERNLEIARKLIALRPNESSDAD